MKALLIFKTIRGSSQRDQRKYDSAHNCSRANNYEEEHGEIRHRNAWSSSKTSENSGRKRHTAASENRARQFSRHLTDT